LQVGFVRLGRSEEIENVLQAILDRPEVRTIAPALANVERRLAETAPNRGVVASAIRARGGTTNSSNIAGDMIGPLLKHQSFAARIPSTPIASWASRMGMRPAVVVSKYR
jgi:hypothetical protein